MTDIPSYDLRPNPSPEELPEATVIENNFQHAGKSHLVLRVSIEGRDQNVLLAHDAHEAAGMGPAAVVELKRIATALEGVCHHVRAYRQNPSSTPAPSVKKETG